MARANCSAKFGFVKYRYRLHAETAKKELHDRPGFGGLCPSIQIGESSASCQKREVNTEGGEGGSTEKDRGVGGFVLLLVPINDRKSSHFISNFCMLSCVCFLFLFFCFFLTDAINFHFWRALSLVPLKPFFSCLSRLACVRPCDLFFDFLLFLLLGYMHARTP